MTAFVECFAYSSGRHCEVVYKNCRELNVSLQTKTASPALNDCANIAHQNEGARRRNLVRLAARVKCTSAPERIPIAWNCDDAAGNFYRCGICIRNHDACDRHTANP